MPGPRPAGPSATAALDDARPRARRIAPAAMAVAQRARPVAAPLLAAALLAAGAWQCLVMGHAVNGDGISYLDLADQYARGDWTAFRNGYWSPAYPALLGLLFRVTGVGAAREIVAVYALNVAVLGAAMGVFAWWLRELGWRRTGAGWARAPLALPVRAAAWTVFAWHMLRLVGIATVTPDGLVALCFYACLAMIARRMRAGSAGGAGGAGSAGSADVAARAPERAGAGAREATAFGVLLGIGYLAKAVLFPVGAVLALAYLMAGHREGARRRARVALLVAAAFLATSAPLLVVQSLRASRPSIGATGQLAYAWYVSKAPHPEVADPGSAPQPGLAIALPAVQGALLFADSLPGTFPYWYDASRWSPRARATFDAGGQLGVLRNSLRWYRMIAWWPLLLAAGPILVGVAARRRLRWNPWPLLLGPAALVGAYALVHPEGRLAGPGIAAGLVTLLALPGPPGAGERPALRWAFALALVAVLARDIGRDLWAWGPADARRWSDVAVAEGVRDWVPRGGDVGVIGDPQGHLWAHMAEVHIVATIPPTADAGALPALVQQACGAGRQLRAVMVRGGAPRPGFLPLAGAWQLWPAPRCH